jgi:hypothetical protein
MSNFEYDDDDYGNGNDLVSQLRKALRAKEKEAKDAQAKVEELAKTNAELSGKVRGVSLSEILKTKGAKPALAKFMTDVEATDESVTAWLAENGELFGYTPKAEGAASDGGDTSGQAQQGGEASLTPEMEAALAAMSQVQKQEANAAPGLVGEDKVNDFISRVGQNAQSFEDVEKAFRDAGIV